MSYITGLIYLIFSFVIPAAGHLYLENRSPVENSAAFTVGIMVLPSSRRTPESLKSLVEKLLYQLEEDRTGGVKAFAVIGKHRWNLPPREGNLNAVFQDLLKGLQSRIHKSLGMSVSNSYSGARIPLFIVGHYTSSFWVQEWVSKDVDSWNGADSSTSSRYSSGCFDLSGLMLVSGYMHRQYYDFSKVQR